MESEKLKDMVSSTEDIELFDEKSPDFMRRYGKTYSSYGNLTPIQLKFGKTYSPRGNVKNDDGELNQISESDAKKPTLAHSKPVENAALTKSSSSLYSSEKITAKHSSKIISNDSSKDVGYHGKQTLDVRTQTGTINQGNLKSTQPLCKRYLTAPHKSFSVEHATSKNVNPLRIKNAHSLLAQNINLPHPKALDSGCLKNTSASLGQSSPKPGDKQSFTHDKPVSLEHATSQLNVKSYSGKQVLQRANLPCSQKVMLEDSSNVEDFKSALDFAIQQISLSDKSSKKIIVLKNADSAKPAVKLLFLPENNNKLNVSPVPKKGGGGASTMVQERGSPLKSKLNLDKNAAGNSKALVEQIMPHLSGIINTYKPSQNKMATPVYKKTQDMKTVEILNEDGFGHQSERSILGPSKNLKKESVLPVPSVSELLQRGTVPYSDTIELQSQNNVSKSTSNSSNEETTRNSHPAEKINPDMLVNEVGSMEPEKNIKKEKTKGPEILEVLFSDDNHPEECDNLSRTEKEVLPKSVCHSLVSENATNFAKSTILGSINSLTKENDNCVEFSQANKILKKIEKKDILFEEDDTDKKKDCDSKGVVSIEESKGKEDIAPEENKKERKKDCSFEEVVMIKESKEKKDNASEEDNDDKKENCSSQWVVSMKEKQDISFEENKDDRKNDCNSEGFVSGKKDKKKDFSFEENNDNKKKNSDSERVVIIKEKNILFEENNYDRKKDCDFEEVSSMKETKDISVEKKDSHSEEVSSMKEMKDISVEKNNDDKKKDSYSEEVSSMNEKQDILFEENNNDRKKDYNSEEFISRKKRKEKDIILEENTDDRKKHCKYKGVVIIEKKKEKGISFGENTDDRKKDCNSEGVVSMKEKQDISFEENDKKKVSNSEGVASMKKKKKKKDILFEENTDDRKKDCNFEEVFSRKKREEKKNISFEVNNDDRKEECYSEGVVSMKEIAFEEDNDDKKKDFNPEGVVRMKKKKKKKDTSFEENTDDRKKDCDSEEMVSRKRKRKKKDILFEENTDDRKKKSDTKDIVSRKKRKVKKDIAFKVGLFLKKRKISVRMKKKKKSEDCARIKMKKNKKKKNNDLEKDVCFNNETERQEEVSMKKKKIKYVRAKSKIVPADFFCSDELDKSFFFFDTDNVLSLSKNKHLETNLLKSQKKPKSSTLHKQIKDCSDKEAKPLNQFDNVDSKMHDEILESQMENLKPIVQNEQQQCSRETSGSHLADSLFVFRTATEAATLLGTAGMCMAGTLDAQISTSSVNQKKKINFSEVLTKLEEGTETVLKEDEMENPKSPKMPADTNLEMFQLPNVSSDTKMPADTSLEMFQSPNVSSDTSLEMFHSPNVSSGTKERKTKFLTKTNLETPEGSAGVKIKKHKLSEASTDTEKKKSKLQKFSIDCQENVNLALSSALISPKTELTPGSSLVNTPVSSVTTSNTFEAINSDITASVNYPKSSFMDTPTSTVSKNSISATINSTVTPSDYQENINLTLASKAISSESHPVAESSFLDISNIETAKNNSSSPQICIQKLSLPLVSASANASTSLTTNSTITTSDCQRQKKSVSSKVVLSIPSKDSCNIPNTFNDDILSTVEKHLAKPGTSLSKCAKKLGESVLSQCTHTQPNKASEANPEVLSTSNTLTDDSALPSVSLSKVPFSSVATSSTAKVDDTNSNLVRNSAREQDLQSQAEKICKKISKKLYPSYKTYMYPGKQKTSTLIHRLCNACHHPKFYRHKLAVHMRMCWDTWPYHCIFCRRKFLHRTCLLVHRTVHKGKIVSHKFSISKTSLSANLNLTCIKKKEGQLSSPSSSLQRKNILHSPGEKNVYRNKEKSCVPTACLSSSSSRASASTAAPRQMERKFKMQLLQKYLAKKKENIAMISTNQTACKRAIYCQNSVSPKKVSANKYPLKLSLKFLSGDCWKIKPKKKTPGNTHLTNEADNDLSTNQKNSNSNNNFQVNSTEVLQGNLNASRTDPPVTEVNPSGNESVVSNISPPLLFPLNVSPTSSTPANEPSASLLNIDSPPFLPKIPLANLALYPDKKFSGSLKNMAKDLVNAEENSAASGTFHKQEIVKALSVDDQNNPAPSESGQPVVQSSVGRQSDGNESGKSSDMLLVEGSHEITHEICKNVEVGETTKESISEISRINEYSGQLGPLPPPTNLAKRNHYPVSKKHHPIKSKLLSDKPTEIKLEPITNIDESNSGTEVSKLSLKDVCPKPNSPNEESRLHLVPVQSVPTVASTNCFSSTVSIPVKSQSVSFELSENLTKKTKKDSSQKNKTKNVSNDNTVNNILNSDNVNSINNAKTDISTTNNKVGVVTTLNSTTTTTTNNNNNNNNKNKNNSKTNISATKSKVGVVPTLSTSTINTSTVPTISTSNNNNINNSKTNINTTNNKVSNVTTSNSKTNIDATNNKNKVNTTNTKRNMKKQTTNNTKSNKIVSDKVNTMTKNVSNNNIIAKNNTTNNKINVKNITTDTTNKNNINYSKNKSSINDTNFTNSKTSTATNYKENGKKYNTVATTNNNNNCKFSYENNNNKTSIATSYKVKDNIYPVAKCTNTCKICYENNSNINCISHTNNKTSTATNYKVNNNICNAVAKCTNTCKICYEINSNINHTNVTNSKPRYNLRKRETKNIVGKSKLRSFKKQNDVTKKQQQKNQTLKNVTSSCTCQYQCNTLAAAAAAPPPPTTTKITCDKMYSKTITKSAVIPTSTPTQSPKQKIFTKSATTDKQCPMMPTHGKPPPPPPPSTSQLNTRAKAPATAPPSSTPLPLKSQHEDHPQTTKNPTVIPKRTAKKSGKNSKESPPVKLLPNLKPSFVSFNYKLSTLVVPPVLPTSNSQHQELLKTLSVQSYGAIKEVSQTSCTESPMSTRPVQLRQLLNKTIDEGASTEPVTSFPPHSQLTVPMSSTLGTSAFIPINNMVPVTTTTNVHVAPAFSIPSSGMFPVATPTTFSVMPSTLGTSSFIPLTSMSVGSNMHLRLSDLSNSATVVRNLGDNQMSSTSLLTPLMTPLPVAQHEKPGLLKSKVPDENTKDSTPSLTVKNEVEYEDNPSRDAFGLQITDVVGNVTTHQEIPTNSDPIYSNTAQVGDGDNDAKPGLTDPGNWLVIRTRPLRCLLIEKEDRSGVSEFFFECCGLSFSKIPELASHLDSCHK